MGVSTQVPMQQAQQAMMGFIPPTATGGPPAGAGGIQTGLDQGGAVTAAIPAAYQFTRQQSETVT